MTMLMSFVCKRWLQTPRDLQPELSRLIQENITYTMLRRQSFWDWLSRYNEATRRTKKAIQGQKSSSGKTCKRETQVL